MSSDSGFLALRLEGPLQSWGFDSQYSRRNTGLFPTKSAIAGMCCAAFGFHRGSREESDFLLRFKDLQMMAIAIPRMVERKFRNEVKKRTLNVKRLQDWHTVQNTMKATGVVDKNCVITHRQYLTDASFGVLLAGDGKLLKEIANALENPTWGLWLGRKSCIPTAPVLAGLRSTQGEALKLLVGDIPLEFFTRQKDVETFAEGRDSLPDQPVSFSTNHRAFSPRRVGTIQGI